MTPQQFETDVMNLLHIPMAGPNDPGLVPRLQKLQAEFMAVDDPAMAAALYSRLEPRNGPDSFGREFHYRLSRGTVHDLLGILEKTAKQEAAKKPVPAPAAPRGKEYPLWEFKDGVLQIRMISLTDEEYRDRFIGNHIKNLTADPDPNTFEVNTMVIHFDDGRQIQLPLDAVPVRYSFPGMIRARIGGWKDWSPPVDHYLLKDGIIIPMDGKDQMVLHSETTPTLVDLRTALEINIQRRRALLELAMLVNSFASIIAMNTSVLHLSMEVSTEGSIFRSTREPSRSKPSGGGKPPDATYRVKSQFRQVTAQEMLMWENEGGHTLGRHNWQLTSDKLLERVVGESNLRVQPTPSNPKPEDFRVWRGKTWNAASRWADQETMYKAIAQVIHDNIDEIRNSTTGDKPWERTVRLGYTTGSGWVATDNKKNAAGRGVLWDENLTGMTIVIKRRAGHIPSAQDPEGWYVLTAYPDRAR